jgi:hypothetical protein
MKPVLLACLLVGAHVSLPAQAPPRQTESDAYTRYELLAPGSARFRIIYEVTATTTGATDYFNPIRKGSVATDESVSDRATGTPLAFDVVGAAEARAGGVRSNDMTQTYIRVKLSRPVPADGGEARVLILKTYQDSLSYFTRGDTIVFTRPLGIRRNAVVLPQGYELVSSSFPAQVLQEPDGRVGISFWNETPSEAAVTMRAVPARGMTAAQSSVAARLDERAHQNREIVYFLRQPETGTFDLSHDYTESRHLPQHRSRRQHRLGAARGESRHRRAARVGNAEGRCHHACKAGREGRHAEDGGGGLPLSRRAGRYVAAAAHVRDVHRHGAVPARRQRAGLGPELRTSVECRGASGGLDAHQQLHPRGREHAARRARTARLHQSSPGRNRHAHHGKTARAVARETFSAPSPEQGSLPNGPFGVVDDSACGRLAPHSQ